MMADKNNKRDDFPQVDTQKRPIIVIVHKKE